MNLTKTPYLVLFVVLGAAGITTAWAVGTVTLSADNVVVTNNMAVDTDTLVVDAANDRVGIGTATPTSKLHVVGDLTLQSSLLCPGGACVGGEDVTDGSIGGADVADGSIGRSDVASITSGLTGPVGGNGGAPFSLDCGLNGVVVGIDGKVGDNVDSIQLVCRQVRSPIGAIGTVLGPIYFTSAVGGSGGSSWGTALRCPDNYVLTIILGTTAPGPGFVLSQLMIECVSIITLDVFASNLVGNNPGPDFFNIICPEPNHVISRVDGRAGQLIDQIEGHCY